VASSDNWASWRPGTTYEYSNSGTALAALLVEHVTKTDFSEYTKKKIFGPLGMKDTAWFLRELDVAKIAIPYDGIAPAHAPIDHYGYAEYPCGQLRSSATQMARFLAMVTQKGELDGARVLKTGTVTEMTRPHLDGPDAYQAIFFYFLEHAGGVNAIGHNGGDVGVHTNMFYDPKDGAGYVLLTNASTDGSFANGGVPVPEPMLIARAQLQDELLSLAKRIP
jgi:CubicO group peptidase (beta-lactamase class C family)